MVKKEITNERDLKYSLWHRTLSDRCLTWNIDFVEVRRDEIVALIEVAETNYPLELVDLRFKQGHKFLLEKIYQMTKIPVYIVFHNFDMTFFKRFNLVNGLIDLLTEKDYRNWLENL